VTAKDQDVAGGLARFWRAVEDGAWPLSGGDLPCPCAQCLHWKRDMRHLQEVLQGHDLVTADLRLTESGAAVMLQHRLAGGG
jgi:hypothetical protein